MSAIIHVGGVFSKEKTMTTRAQKTKKKEKRQHFKSAKIFLVFDNNFLSKYNLRDCLRSICQFKITIEVSKQRSLKKDVGKKL